MEKRKVLIIDDDHRITRTLKVGMERTGRFQVVTENESVKGLTTMRAFKPDVVLLDIMMPNMDGSDIAAEMRDDPRLRDTRVVFLTGNVRDDEVDAHGGVIGGQRFIAKPATLEEVLDCVEDCLR